MAEEPDKCTTMHLPGSFLFGRTTSMNRGIIKGES